MPLAAENCLDFNGLFRITLAHLTSGERRRAMFNSGVLDLVIGLIFVYLMLSLICTAVTEWLAGKRRLRGKVLRQGIQQLLTGSSDKTSLADQFYNHPLVKALSPPKGAPSYIASRTFAKALLDILAKDIPTRANSEKAQEEVPALTESSVNPSLLSLVRESSQNPDAIQDQLETLYNNSMDRVAGWYKRKAQTMTLVIGAIITILANADTLTITQTLWANPTLRASIVEQAKVRAQQPLPLNVEYTDSDSPVPNAPIVKPPEEVSKSNSPVLSEEENKALGALLSWSADLQALNQDFLQSKGCTNLSSCVVGLVSWLVWILRQHLVGWVLTIFAVSLGAPFWFDLLNKFINIRSGGKPLLTSKSQTK